MSRIITIVLAGVIVLAIAAGFLFGLMVLAGLSSTAGDKYGPLARALGFTGVILVVPAFSFGRLMARRRRNARDRSSAESK